MDLRQQMDRIYEELAPDEIPWNMVDPPAELVELVDSGRLSPCAAVDLGCGAGNAAVWLAERGFEVTGVDLSARAVAMARERAGSAGVECRFEVADLTGDSLDDLGPFDFAFDWELLHHVFPDHREAYVRNVHRLLRPGARYLSVCFSEDDPFAGGVGKFRTTRLGTTLYFSSEQELQALFERWFRIDEIATVSVRGKHGPHRAVRALMLK